MHKVGKKYNNKYNIHQPINRVSLFQILILDWSSFFLRQLTIFLFFIFQSACARRGSPSIEREGASPLKSVQRAEARQRLSGRLRRRSYRGGAQERQNRSDALAPGRSAVHPGWRGGAWSIASRRPGARRRKPGPAVHAGQNSWPTDGLAGARLPANQSPMTRDPTWNRLLRLQFEAKSKVCPTSSLNAEEKFHAALPLSGIKQRKINFDFI